MARVLIVYSTSEGQTAKISHEMSGWLAAKGHEVEAHRVQDLPNPTNVGGFDAVIAGSSVHQGELDGALAHWASTNLRALGAAHSAFFSVSLSAAGGKKEDHAELRRITDSYLAAIGWKPEQVAFFAGALAYSQYGLVKRFIMQNIARKEGGGTDPSRDYEYTNWESVRHFAEDVVESCEEAANSM